MNCGSVEMVIGSKKGEAINSCDDKSKNSIMIHDPRPSYSVYGCNPWLMVTSVNEVPLFGDIWENNRDS